MSNFLNGPAASTTLCLSRSPYFLRAVMSPDGKWDALDQLDDTPAADEQIHVYRIASEPAVAHIDGRDPKTGKRYGRWLSVADYVLHDEQPDDATARDKESWQKWCEGQGLKIAFGTLPGGVGIPIPLLGQCLDDRQKDQTGCPMCAAGGTHENDPERPCSACGETIGHGAHQHICDRCGEECCTACSNDGPNNTVLCDECYCEDDDDDSESDTTPNNRAQDGRVCDCEDAPCCGCYVS